MGTQLEDGRETRHAMLLRRHDLWLRRLLGAYLDRFGLDPRRDHGQAELHPFMHHIQRKLTLEGDRAHWPPIVQLFVQSVMQRKWLGDKLDSLCRLPDEQSVWVERTYPSHGACQIVDSQ